MTQGLKSSCQTKVLPITKIFGINISHITRKNAHVMDKWGYNDSQKPATLVYIPATFQGSQGQERGEKATLSILQGQKLLLPVSLAIFSHIRIYRMLLCSSNTSSSCLVNVRKAFFCYHGTTTISCFQVLDILKWQALFWEISSLMGSATLANIHVSTGWHKSVSLSTGSVFLRPENVCALTIRPKPGSWVWMWWKFSILAMHLAKRP